MKIEIYEGTPFLADITADYGQYGARYRLIVEDEGATSLYVEIGDKFKQPYWEPVANSANYRNVVAEIIVALSQRGMEENE